MKLFRKASVPRHKMASRMYRQWAGVALLLVAGLGMQAGSLGAEIKSEEESVAADGRHP